MAIFFRRAFSLLTVGILAMIFFVSKPSLGGERDEMPKVLRAGFLSCVFSDVDSRDAQASLELLTCEISRNMGLKTTPKVIIYPEIKSMTDAIRRGELDLISMPTIEFLRIREKFKLIPAFVGAHNNGLGTRYALITRRDSGIRSFADLKGKTLFLPSFSRHEPSHVWLDVLLMKEGNGNPAMFFHQVKETQKVSQAIMGVFFRQADGAIVSRSGLDASRLLNPQLDRQLVVLAESRDLSDGVSCFPADASETMRRALTKAVIQVNNSPSGRQLYTIFQTSGALLFRPACLDGLEDLVREQKRLKSKGAKRK